MPNLYNKIIPVAKKKKEGNIHATAPWNEKNAKQSDRRWLKSTPVEAHPSNRTARAEAGNRNFARLFPGGEKISYLEMEIRGKKKKKKEEVDWPVTGSMARTGLHTRGARIAAGPSGSPTAHRRAITSHRGPAITNGDLSLSISLVKPPPSHPPPPPLFNPPPSRFPAPSSLSAYPTA